MRVRQVPPDALGMDLGAAADPDEAALGYVELASVGTFSSLGQAVEKDGKVLPEELPEGVTLRKTDETLDFTLTVALPAAGTDAANALLAVMGELELAAGPRLAFVAPDQEADLRLAVLPDSARPDAVWVLPSTGLAEDLGATPSGSTGDKDGSEVAAALADMLVTMARAQNLLKLAGAMGAVIPAKPQSPVEDLSYLAQAALDVSRAVGGQPLTRRCGRRGLVRRRGGRWL